MSDTRTEAERRYDATRLSPVTESGAPAALDTADTLIRAVLAPAAELPEVEVLAWESEDHHYTDYYVGIGPVRTVIGTYDGDKAGIELIIGGVALNTGLEEIITLADVRQLRDNLTALLSDARLLAAVGE